MPAQTRFNWKTVAMLIFAGLLGMAAAVFVLGAEQGNKAQTIRAQTIELADENGVPRIVLSAMLPDPKVKGKVYPRSVKAAGMQFNDAAGNEVGGIAVFERIGGGALCFDYSTAEAVCLSKIENANFVGLTILDQPPASSEVGQPGSQRLLFAVENGEAKLVLSDQQGKERIRLSVDSSNRPSVQVFDASGRVVQKIPAP